jgi:hypothetical protein
MSGYGGDLFELADDGAIGARLHILDATIKETFALTSGRRTTNS